MAELNVELLLVISRVVGCEDVSLFLSSNLPNLQVLEVHCMKSACGFAVAHLLRDRVSSLNPQVPLSLAIRDKKPTNQVREYLLYNANHLSQLHANLTFLNMGLKVAYFIAWGLGVLVIPTAGDDSLRHDYYCETCPKAEATIAKMMDEFIGRDARVPARIIRMHFHDCFVRGCDASVLLNSTLDNQAERDAPANNPSLHGFELIDQIKQVLEDQCPGVVSCADIIAYAARESVRKAGKFERYPVRGGRKDGKISRASEVAGNIPAPSFVADALIKQFASKGLSVDELVALSGAHSIGVSHCSSLQGRQVNFSQTGKPDPTLDHALARRLRSECPSQSKANPTVVMDRDTPVILDNKYYEGVLRNKGLFTSDQTLLANKCTKALVVEHAAQASAWEKKFVEAMIKMGEIEVLKGKKGEVRKKCSLVNKA